VHVGVLHCTDSGEYWTPVMRWELCCVVLYYLNNNSNNIAHKDDDNFMMVRRIGTVEYRFQSNFLR
jgi:hypothetical protein